MHPYGHGRAEGIAACMVGIVLLGVVFVIAWNAIGELRSAEPKARPHWLVPVLALTSIVVNEVLYQYKRRVSARTSSQAVSAEGWHHRSDAFSSIPVLIGTGVAVIGGGRWTLLDPVAALMVAGFILVAAVAVLREAGPEMLDASVSEETISRLKDVARAVPGVLDVEATRGRRSGLGLLVELHVEVAPSASVEEGHRVAQRVRDALLTSEERVADAVIHIEPYYANDH
jgi:cation diffusion facilitator family transporter